MIAHRKPLLPGHRAPEAPRAGPKRGWLAAALALGGLLSSCGTLGSYQVGAGVYGRYDYPYYYYPPSAYYDWFAYGPTFRGPYYHPYPNIEYFVEYRPIYP